jgi:hypothetical protein
VEQQVLNITWAEMNDQLRAADEAACWALLENEQQHACRVPFLLRIFGKANKLRTERERAEIMQMEVAKAPESPVVIRSPKNMVPQAQPLTAKKAAAKPTPPVVASNEGARRGTLARRAAR